MGLDTPCITVPNAPTSMGSPRPVPVPCISNEAMSPGDSAESSSAALMTLDCAGPFGAVKELDRPSWLRAVALNIP